jgi:hypothetical protein
MFQTSNFHLIAVDFSDIKFDIMPSGGVTMQLAIGLLRPGYVLALIEQPLSAGGVVNTAIVLFRRLSL